MPTNVRKKLYAFTNAYLLLLLLTIPILTFLPGYLGYEVNVAVSFWANDGWCKIGLQSIGTHCFGDYYYPLTVTSENNPWRANLGIPYTPISTFMFKPFQWLSSITHEPRLGMIIYISLLVLCAAYPVIHMGVSKIIPVKILPVALAATFTVAPIIVALDRGNNTLLMLPLIYHFSTAVLNRNNRCVITMVVLMTTFKPQFILLALIFLGLRNFRSFIKTLVISGFSLILSFILYPSGVVTNLISWIENLKRYQELNPEGTIAVDYSFTNCVRIIRTIIMSMNASQSTKFEYSTFISVALASVTGILLWKCASYTTVFEKLIVTSLATLVIPGVVYQYYGIILLGPLYLICISFFSKNSNIIQSCQYAGVFKFCETKLLANYTLSAFAITFIPMPIPYKAIGLFKNSGFGNISISTPLVTFTLNTLLILLLSHGMLKTIRQHERSKV